MEKNKATYKTKRTRGVLKLEDGREIPLTVSCRSDGECVILPRTMDELIFPKSVEKGKKAAKEEVK